MMKSGNYYLSKVDKKGRIQLPLEVREAAGIYGQVLIEKEKGELHIKPLPNIADPVKFLSSLNIKTKKSPVEMKKEAEDVFS